MKKVASLTALGAVMEPAAIPVLPAKPLPEARLKGKRLYREGGNDVILT